MTAVCETLGVARSNIARRVTQGPSKRRGRPALSEEPLLSEIMTVIAEMPSYGYPEEFRTPSAPETLQDLPVRYRASVSDSGHGQAFNRDEE